MAFRWKWFESLGRSISTVSFGWISLRVRLEDVLEIGTVGSNVFRCFDVSVELPWDWFESPGLFDQQVLVGSIYG